MATRSGKLKENQEDGAQRHEKCDRKSIGHRSPPCCSLLEVSLLSLAHFSSYSSNPVALNVVSQFSCEEEMELVADGGYRCEIRPGY